MIIYKAQTGQIAGVSSSLVLTEELGLGFGFDVSSTDIYW